MKDRQRGTQLHVRADHRQTDGSDRNYAISSYTDIRTDICGGAFIHSVQAKILV